MVSTNGERKQLSILKFFALLGELPTNLTANFSWPFSSKLVLPYGFIPKLIMYQLVSMHKLQAKMMWKNAIDAFDN